MNIASTEANNKLREAQECFFDNVSFCVALDIIEFRNRKKVNQNKENE